MPPQSPSPPSLSSPTPFADRDGINATQPPAPVHIPRRSLRHLITRLLTTHRLPLLCIFFALGSFSWGYDVGVLASVLAHPGFARALTPPSRRSTDQPPPTLSAATRGLITSVYYLGTLLSYLFLSHPLSDRVGRRYASLTGAVVASIGVYLQSSVRASSFASIDMAVDWQSVLPVARVLLGRVVTGLGIAVLSTAVPMYQAEVAPRRRRGRYVVLNHVGFTTGLACGFWVGWLVAGWREMGRPGSWTREEGWRFALAAQFLPAGVFVLGLPFVPETPRWLLEHGFIERARTSLAWLRAGGGFSVREIAFEFDEIRSSVDQYRATTVATAGGSKRVWTTLFTDPPLFRRLWRAALLQFMAQMCGATAMKYYLPALFRVLGLGTRLSLMAGGIESTLKIGCTVIEAIVIDRLGRRITLVAGCFVMAFSMLINAVLPLAYPDNNNRAADYACIAFIFVYSLGYSMGFGPSAWVYGSEIFPTKVRARGLNFAASAGAVGSVIVAQIWPVGIERIGSKIYFFFVAVNLACVPVIYLFYPETKGRALEDMDSLFGKAVTATPMGDNDEEGIGSADLGGAYEDDPLPLSPRTSRDVGRSASLESSGLET